MDSLEQVLELEPQASDHHVHAEIEKVLENRRQVEPAGNSHLGARGRQQAGQVDVVIDLQRRVLEQVSERGVGARARPELEHDPDVVGAQVLDVDELRYLPLADQLADSLDEGVLFDSVGNRRDQHRVVAIGMRLVSSPQLDRPLPGGVDLANLFGRIENHSPGGKIGAVNVLQQPIQRQLAIVQERHQRGADFLQVMGRNIGGHPHRDSRRPVDQQVGKLGRQNLGLKGGRGIVWAQVDRLIAELAQECLGDRSQPAFGVPHGRRRVAVDRAEVAVSFDHGVTQAERLGHPHQRVVDRLVAVGVIGLHDLANDGRRLDVTAIGREVQVRPHRIENAPLHRLQAVANIGQRGAVITLSA